MRFLGVRVSYGRGKSRLTHVRGGGLLFVRATNTGVSEQEASGVHDRGRIADNEGWGEHGGERSGTEEAGAYVTI